MKGYSCELPNYQTPSVTQKHWTLIWHSFQSRKTLASTITNKHNCLGARYNDGHNVADGWSVTLSIFELISLELTFSNLAYANIQCSNSMLCAICHNVYQTSTSSEALFWQHKPFNLLGWSLFTNLFFFLESCREAQCSWTKRAVYSLFWQSKLCDKPLVFAT